MAYLYVWERNKDSYGHAALLLRESNIYISWWPKEDKVKRSVKKKKTDIKDHLPESYDEDVTDFNGRPATHRFEISSDKIDAIAVASWWERTRGTGGYNLVGRNCCDVVYEAMKVGGCFDWVQPGFKIISTPEGMIRYGEALQSSKGKIPAS